MGSDLYTSNFFILLVIFGTLLDCVQKNLLLLWNFCGLEDTEFWTWFHTKSVHKYILNLIVKTKSPFHYYFFVIAHCFELNFSGTLQIVKDHGSIKFSLYPDECINRNLICSTSNHTSILTRDKNRKKPKWLQEEVEQFHPSCLFIFCLHLSKYLLLYIDTLSAKQNVNL